MNRKRFRCRFSRWCLSSSSFSGHLHYYSCPFSTPTGLRCPRGSFVHAPYCRFHLRSVLGLDVAPSTIPDAGHGLFTLIPRSKGAHLIDYLGEVLSGEVEKRYPRDSLGVYSLALSSSLFIDSALHRGIGAIANAPPPRKRANACYVINVRTQSARIETSRAIEAGGEIFISYGPNYWKHARSIIHSTSIIPEWEWDLSDPFANIN